MARHSKMIIYSAVRSVASSVGRSLIHKPVNTISGPFVMPKQVRGSMVTCGGILPETLASRRSFS